MPTTINGISAYAFDTRGTAQRYIRVSAVAVDDVASFDAAETAGASAAGTQTVNFDGSLVGTADAGLGAGTFTASIVLDGTTYPISITLTGGESVDAVITAINADLPGTECALSGGNIVVTSPSTGLSSYVSITDTNLFSGMTGFLKIDDAVDGGLGGQLKSTTLPNGANAYKAYIGAVETYDTASDRVVVSTDATSLTDNSTGTAGTTVVDAGASYTQANLNDNFATLASAINALVTKVNSLQDLVEKGILHK